MRKWFRYKAPKIETVIGAKTKISGNVSFSGGLHIDGAVNGTVFAESDTASLLAVGAGGLIKGDVNVETIVLNGTVEGDIVASGLVELVPGAKVHGTVYYRVLEMAMGAEVNGKLVPLDEKEASDRQTHDHQSGLAPVREPLR